MTNNSHPANHLTFVNHSPVATYRDVGEYVLAAKGIKIMRADLDAAFPGLPSKKLSKALENACAKGLIHSVDRGVYLGGKRPPRGQIELPVSAPVDIAPVAPAFKSPVIRNVVVAKPDCIDTSAMIEMALQSMPVIEKVWFKIAGNRTGAGMAMA